MKSVVSWHYLTHEIETVRAGNVASVSYVPSPTFLQSIPGQVLYASEGNVHGD